METRTDNDLICGLYRPYLALTRAVAADEDDLDRRFDHIMDKVAQQPQPHPPTARPRPAHLAPGRRLFTHLAASTLAGAGVAVAGGATRLMTGVVNFVVITVAAAVTVFAVTAVGDHCVARHKRTADTEHDAMAPSPLE
ncbi:hypothetical protein [Streptomyces sp. NPDC001137]|uniref:hypothetical protein n=1 Tax=Streptomyces sp. NPDC001137 TaxID=3154378 RepID=UPI00331FF950